jgi:type 1 fimbria pilin
VASIGGHPRHRTEEGFLKKLIAILAGLAVFAPAALAASSHFLKAPSKTNPGKTVTITGSVDHGCRIGHKNDVATIYSKAFAGVTKRSFAGVPAVLASLSKSKTGAFSIKVTLSKKLKPATYSISGHCGGAKFGTTNLKVVKASPPPPGPQFY